jgi:hypothetical protein
VCACRDRRAAKTQVPGEFQWPQGGVGQPAPRARGARELGRPRSSASGSQVLVTRCVWWLPDHEFALSPPRAAGCMYVLTHERARARGAPLLPGGARPQQCILGRLRVARDAGRQADEGGGESPSASGVLQLVGVLGQGSCAEVNVAAPTAHGVARSANSWATGSLGCSGSIPSSLRYRR